jgi:hypothetical protein
VTKRDSVALVIGVFDPVVFAFPDMGYGEVIVFWVTTEWVDSPEVRSLLVYMDGRAEVLFLEYFSNRVCPTTKVGFWPSMASPG